MNRSSHSAVRSKQRSAITAEPHYKHMLTESRGGMIGVGVVGGVDVEVRDELGDESVMDVSRLTNKEELAELIPFHYSVNENNLLSDYVSKLIHSGRDEEEVIDSLQHYYHVFTSKQ